jgi:hypothetical protein
LRFASSFRPHRWPRRRRPVEPRITRAEDPAAPSDACVNRHWQRNLIVCLFGSFTTVVAMTVMR